MGKKTINFFSQVEGVADSFPILKAKDAIPSWVNDAKKDFLIAQESLNRGFQHITRCPGIFHLFNTGYIVPMWFDLEVSRDQWTVADPSINEFLGKEPMGLQLGEGIAKNIPKRPWSWPDIVKINTPWHVMAPKDVKFLMIPLPYTPFFDFEACLGILDPAYSTEINIQGYLNAPSTFIKAGTPIAQLIPLTEKHYDVIVRDQNENDKLWLKKRKYLNFFSFQYPRHLIKKLYNKHVRDHFQ